MNTNAPLLGLAPAWRNVQYNYPGYDSESYGFQLFQDVSGDTSTYIHSGATVGSKTWSRGCLVGDIYALALDLDNRKVWLRHPVDGWDGDPVAGIGEAFSDILENVMPTVWGQNSITVNFGATGFTCTPPAGFKTLCGTNMPKPTILKSSTVADVVLRTGNGENNYNLFRPVTYNGTLCEGDASSAYLVDGDESTHAKNTIYPAINCYFQVDMGAQLPVEKVGIDHIDIGGGTGGVVKTMRVSVSADGSDWSNYEDISVAALLTLQQFTLTTPMTGRYVRYTCLEQWGVVHWAVTELQAMPLIPATVALPDMEDGPDFVNTKCRTVAHQWMLFDKLRGATNYLNTNGTNIQGTNAETLKKFNDDGYDLGSATYVNQLNASFVDLCLKAGVKQGFEMQRYTGTGVFTERPHSLGKAPTWMMVKRMDVAGDWIVCAMPAKNSAAWILKLNTTDALVMDGYAFGGANPTATTWYTGASSGADTNVLGGEYIAYLFTDSDIIRTFKYYGNALADGPYVDLGGKVLRIPFLKNADTTHEWSDIGTTRSPYNPASARLDPASSAIETVSPSWVFTSTGMKTIVTGASVNGSGNLFVGLAFIKTDASVSNAV